MLTYLTVFYGIIIENDELPILLVKICCNNTGLFFFFLNGSAFLTSVKFCAPDLSQNGLIVAIKSPNSVILIPVKVAVLCARQCDLDEAA